jgi:hypothetical protein
MFSIFNSPRRKPSAALVVCTIVISLLLSAGLGFAADTALSPPGSASSIDSETNFLTDAEKAEGWHLLFDGKSLDGWHNFKKKGVRPGWQVKDGTLMCVDPHNAGDIVINEMFDWFELELDYNISEAGNSGIMFRVTDEGFAVWETGPEFQLEDNVKAGDSQRCGWLYALYQPAIDPATGKPLDATKPVGQWNHVRLLVSPQKCELEINGVKYLALPGFPGEKRLGLGVGGEAEHLSFAKARSIQLCRVFVKGRCCGGKEEA